ncbi:MAG: glycosyltransferase family 2 protein [Prevotella sp.]|nr:glycosyltransferase family 2 protein [Prevotella sp.]MCM1074651.1 glycosyltransferase family 2 protein [Ruminococcus sp.]
MNESVTQKKKVTLLVPAYNEQEALPHFYKRVCDVLYPLENKYDFELLFVNDGSTDSTLQLLKAMRMADSRVNYLDMSRNYGKEIGMLAGFDYAKGDCVITLDADLQEPPEVIPAMLSKWEEGYDDVYGRRKSRKQSFVKRASSRLYHRVLASMSRDADFADDSGDFRLLSRKCVNALTQLRESQRYTKGLYEVMGFKKAPIDYEIEERVAGKSKWSVGKLVCLALNGITSHSVVPLRIASYMGMIVSACAFIYLIVVIVKALGWGDPVVGYPTIVSLILFIGGFILLSLGIIGEYLGRIFMETKHRPVYFLNSYNGIEGRDEKLKEKD